jgi:osmotically inducible lipoprotein OsmB
MGPASPGPRWRDLMSNLTKLLAGALVVLNLAACGSMTTRERDTVVGAGVGTAVGAAVTGDVGGAVGGGVVGGVIGNQIGRRR